MAANAYITVAELKKQPVSMDFSLWSSPELTLLITVACEICESYTKRKFGPASYIEEGETVIDRQGRLVIGVRNKPVSAVTQLQIWVAGMAVSQRLTMNIDYLQLVKSAGYMYYPTTHSPWMAGGASYPSSILSTSENVFYEVHYSVTEPVPESIKYAVALMVSNMLKTDYFFKKEGVAGAKGIESFVSDDYEVKFAQMKNDDNDAVLTPPVRQILNRYGRIGQNSFR